MTMDTNQLIQSLVADNNHRARPVRSMLVTALMIAVPVSIVMFFTALGFRKDIATAFHNPFFDLKFIVTIAVAISAITTSIHLSRPEASLKGRKWLFLLPVALLAFGIGGEMTLTQRLPWVTRLIGSNSTVCLTAIPLLSLPILMAALVALRRGASSRPALSGAYAGLLSAGLAATLYASQCTDDSPWFVAMWYPLAIGLVAAIGALAGSRWLRF